MNLDSIKYEVTYESDNNLTVYFNGVPMDDCIYKEEDGIYTKISDNELDETINKITARFPDIEIQHGGLACSNEAINVVYSTKSQSIMVDNDRACNVCGNFKEIPNVNLFLSYIVNHKHSLKADKDTLIDTYSLDDTKKAPSSKISIQMGEDGWEAIVRKQVEDRLRKEADTNSAPSSTAMMGLTEDEWEKIVRRCLGAKKTPSSGIDIKLTEDEWELLKKRNKEAMLKGKAATDSALDKFFKQVPDCEKTKDEPEQPKDTGYNCICPNCGGPAYQGLGAITCDKCK